MAVKKAIVLAAGLGTRLRPLTLSRPKPLLPVMGEPMLGRILDMLVSWGVEEIKVNAHYLAGSIEEFVAEYSGGNSAEGGRGVSISVSREEGILGTGGVLRPLADWIGDDPFWLVNGDIVVEDLDPEPIEEAFARSGNFAACWMSETCGPRTIEADPEGRVCNWRSEDAGFPGTYTYCGVALLSSEILRHLPEPQPAANGRGEGFCSIVEAYESAMMECAKFVVGVQEPEASWCDAGTVETFKELNSEPMPPSLFGDKRLDKVVEALGRNDAETLAAFIDARGSDRMFYRLYSEDGKSGGPALAVVYETTRSENARFAPITRFLSTRGVNVPELLCDVPESCVYATAFVEGPSIEKLANAKGADILKLYRPVVDVLGALWKIPADDPSMPELEPGFDEVLYAWEIGLFENECVKGRYGLDGIPGDVREELAKIGAELAKEPSVLVHRDFQSSNLLYADDTASSAPFVVDYQGMRKGAAAYDVASLLWDPYVPMEEADRKIILELVSRLEGAPSQRAVSIAAVQRLCQVAGAFCRLAGVGQTKFVKHLGKALHNLHHAVHEADMPAMAEFTHRLMECERFRVGLS